jgi:DNA-binding HxlR family transcriptional regulator
MRYEKTGPIDDGDRRPCKESTFRNLVSPREPTAAPPDPYAAGCPTRLSLDRIGDKWMAPTLSLIRDKPRHLNALRRDIEDVTQKMLSQTLKQMERNGLITRTVLPATRVRSNMRSRRSARRSRPFSTGCSSGRSRAL